MFSELINAIAYRNPQDFWWVCILLLVTFFIVYYLRGRGWAFLYVALIPFLNWTFGNISDVQILAPNATFSKGISLHPMTMVTGLVFVVRDFVQREIGHKVLIIMAMAIAWSFYYSWPVIALASGLAFAVSEGVDWLLFTFTKYRLSTRILLSSAIACPIDTTIFLYGADLARQMALGDEPGSMFHIANWVVFVVGKMVGAVIVSYVIRKREDAGIVSPEAA
ncbi:MAG: hypothetical protein AAF950_05985 [Pseudomonadota bacterium]